MLDKPTTCAQCPAFHTGQGYVPGRGPCTARMALIGQGPGRVEAALGSPFIGPSGKLLSRWLERSGIPESEVYIDNSTRCRLVDSNDRDRKPLAREITYCFNTYVRPVLATMPNLTVIVPIGVPAQYPFLGRNQGERNVGSTHVLDRSSFFGSDLGSNSPTDGRDREADGIDAETAQ